MVSKLRISALSDALAGDLRRAAEMAHEFSLEGLEIDSGSGPFSPGELSRSARRDIRRFFERSGLALSAVRYRPQGGLADTDANDRELPELFKRMELAEQLGSGILVVRIGRLPEEAKDPARRAIEEALKDLSLKAERHGVTLAVGPTEGSPGTLAGVVQAIGSPTIRAELDPGGLVARGFSAAEAAGLLGPLAVHARANDVGADGKTRPPGEGKVPWAEYLAALEGVEYTGFHALDEGPVDKAVRFLRGI